MTLLQFPFTGTSGATVSTAASVGASARLVNSGSVITWDNAYGVHGTGLKFAAASAVACTLDFAFNAANNQAQISVEITTPTTAPASALTLFSIRHASGVVGRVLIGTTGNIAFNDSVSGVQLTVAAGASWSTKYRMTINMVGGSTTAGQVAAKVYLSGTSTQFGAGASSSVANLTANPISAVRLGDTGPAATYGFDELQMNDGAGAEIPALTVMNQPPVVTVTGNQNKATGDTATITVTDSDPDGTIASRALTFEYPTTGAPTITGAGTASPSFPVGATEGVLYELLETVADDGGATASARTEVRVPITTNSDVRPLPKDAGKAGTFNRVGGSATDGAALADGSNTTYLESGSVSSTGQVARIRLAPRTALGSGAQIGVTLQSDTGTTNWQIRLYQGGTSTVGTGTLRKTWTQSAVGTAWTEYLLTIDDTSLAAISDWGGLYLETEVTG